MRVFIFTNPLKRNALSLLAMLSLLGCSSAFDQFNIEIEPTLGVLGGAILATQNTGLVALAPKKVNPILKMRTMFNPMSEAFAGCPAVTLGSCLDDLGANTPGSNINLQVFYNNCEAAMDSPGYWRSYLILTFESEATCTAVLGAGYTGAGLAAVTGEKVVKRYGSLGDDQNNVRLTTILGNSSEAVYLYSRFDSGWEIPKKGGVEITFTNATTRTINIKGVHAFSYAYIQLPIDISQAYDLNTISASTKVAWDHTINTVKTGDTLFSIGPQVVHSGSSYGFGEQSNAPAATFDGDAVISGNTVQKGAVFRIQQNIATGTAVAVVTEDLVYDDPTCCWPTSGVMESRFDLNYPAPTTEDRIEFLSTSCGAVRYYTAEGQAVRDTLRHCF